MLAFYQFFIREFIISNPGARFSVEGPNKNSYPKSSSKISNLITSEQFCTLLYTYSYSPSFNTDELKNGFAGPKGFRYFREISPRYHLWSNLAGNLGIICGPGTFAGLYRDETSVTQHLRCRFIKVDRKSM